MEPKLPEDVFKTWLEPVPPRLQILGESMDSAKQNLAASFVNGFVNAGFGCDKLLSKEAGNKWIYRNKGTTISFNVYVFLTTVHLLIRTWYAE